MKLPRLPFGLDGYVAIGASVVAALALAGLVYVIREGGKEAQRKKDEPVIAKLNADLGACKANLLAADGKIDEANRATERVRKEGEQKLAQAAAAIKAKQGTIRRYERINAELKAFRPTGDSRCARLISASDAITERLQ